MKLWATSDLHLHYAENRQQLEAVRARPDDWLILAGDVCETAPQLEWCFEQLRHKFARLLWVPGNHELWSLARDPNGKRGEAKYHEMLEVCRRFEVLTPEDPYVVWPGEGGPAHLVPMFLLYDYSFRPASVPRDQALAWAAEDRIVCRDEAVLFSDPYPSREAWCSARVEHTRARLEQLSREIPTVLINHFPLRYDLVLLPRVPRFSLWCGTTKTEDWHTRYFAKVVVSGHLHVPRTEWRDGVRCEEVSWGYPKQWGRFDVTLDGRLREVLPGPAAR